MQKIEFKIIASIILFTIFIVMLQRYQLSESLIEQFKKSKITKNELLANTISPVVSLNISLGLESSNQLYLESVSKSNSDLLKVVLKNKKGEMIYSINKAKTTIKKSDYTYVKSSIQDNLTNENIGTVELYFSDKDYQQIIKQKREITFNVFFISSSLLIIFIVFIRREFRYLKKLTQNVLAYNPKENNYPMVRTAREDEVGFIHNAVVGMVEKINLYSQELDSVNANLEIKVQERTQELEKQRHKAEELVKVKSNFLANMSHEIRTPMNAIIGMGYILSNTNLDEYQKKYLTKIQKVSHNLLSIINDILDFSKLESGKFKIEYREFRLSEVIENLYDIFEDKLQEKDLLYNVEGPDEKYLHYGDSLRIEQILINLIGNAIKFTSDGGIKLSIEYLEDEYVRFCVEDSGIGLSKEEQEHLFEAFRQVDESTTRKYGGTGLGLSIVKQLVEQMQGRVFVESVVDVGSRFIFELRLPKMKILQNDNLRKSSQKKEKKVMLLDDSLSQEEIEVLFEDMMSTAKTKLPKVFEPSLEKMQKYKLNKGDAELLQKIQLLYKTYNFKKIIELLDER